MTYAKNRVDFNNLNSFYNMSVRVNSVPIPAIDTYLGGVSANHHVQAVYTISMTIDELCALFDKITAKLSKESEEEDLLEVD